MGAEQRLSCVCHSCLQASLSEGSQQQSEALAAAQAALKEQLSLTADNLNARIDQNSAALQEAVAGLEVSSTSTAKPSHAYHTLPCFNRARHGSVYA